MMVFVHQKWYYVLRKKKEKVPALTSCNGGATLLSEYPIHTALPATDLERAKRFYADKLGLTPESEGPDGLFYRCGGGTRFLVFPSGGTASGTHTQLLVLGPRTGFRTYNLLTLCVFQREFGESTVLTN